MNNDKELIKKMVAVCEEYDDEYDVHQVMQAVADVCAKHYRQHDAEKVLGAVNSVSNKSKDRWLQDEIIKALKQYYGVSDEHS